MSFQENNCRRLDVWRDSAGPVQGGQAGAANLLREAGHAESQGSSQGAQLSDSLCPVVCLYCLKPGHGLLLSLPQ